MQKIKLKWQNPLKLAEKISHNYLQEDWIFLYSGLNDKVKNSYSYIAVFPQEKITSDDFLAAKKIINDSAQKWFGYLSYELINDFKTKKSPIDLPKIYLLNFALIFEFNHDKKTLTAIFNDKSKLDTVLEYKLAKPIATKIKVINFNSNFSNQSYLAEINKIKQMISDGDFYQVNLTRKFFGEFNHKLSQKENFQLFLRLTKLSPANYSSFLKLNENYIISASPELFLKIKNQYVLSRPIKGTAPRSSDTKQDRKNKLSLKNSPKEQAENLMIVDLVRNDLARVCKAGTIVVKKLFNITSYKNIHHMSSEITGKIDKRFDVFDSVQSSFPAGSMTGAPKIKSMEIISLKEKINRGIYSGAIGYLSKSEANLSVVIRTLILSNEKFEFQVGGAITFDSQAKSELEEIFNKAKSIAQLLGINLKK